jgi:hypothetical protein
VLCRYRHTTEDVIALSFNGISNRSNKGVKHVRRTHDKKPTAQWSTYVVSTVQATRVFGALRVVRWLDRHAIDGSQVESSAIHFDRQVLINGQNK